MHERMVFRLQFAAICVVLAVLSLAGLWLVMPEVVEDRAHRLCGYAGGCRG